MKSNDKWFLILSLIVTLLIVSCASTSLTTVWKDDNYQGRITNVLILGISKEPAKKRFFEDEFARQLQARGVRAIASYALFPSDRMVEKEDILAQVNNRDIDALIVTRTVNKKTVETHVPGTVHYAPPHPYRRWHGYYADSYRAVYTPGYTVTDEVVILETNLYDTKNEELIWSAMSETFKDKSEFGLIKEYIELLVKNMVEKNLL